MTKALLGVPGQVTQIHLQGIAELGLQLSQGLLVAEADVDAGGRETSPKEHKLLTVNMKVDWAPGL